MHEMVKMQHAVAYLHACRESRHVISEGEWDARGIRYAEVLDLINHTPPCWSGDPPCIEGPDCRQHAWRAR
jgi:hypothetical protein